MMDQPGHVLPLDRTIRAVLRRRLHSLAGEIEVHFGLDQEGGHPMTMRYRRLGGYRYTMIQRSTWPVTPAPWARDVLNLLLGNARWSPDADLCETPLGIEVVVDVAGVQEDDVEVQLFDDALVVQGQRYLPTCEEGSVYHAVGIQQGPFRLEVPLPALVDAASVEARYERGLLRITMRKQEARG